MVDLAESLTVEPVLTEENEAAVLLFSGGRDSTIAALRLAKKFTQLVLVTVTSAHLVDLPKVKKRLIELRQQLSATTMWIHALVGPSETDGGLLIQIGANGETETCLPCHQAYFRVALQVARTYKTKFIASGYTSYQSDWLEQSEYACGRLRQVLSSYGFELLLPAYDVRSKADACSILAGAGMSQFALEQKCLKQQFNESCISPQMARALIDNWAASLEINLNRPEVSDCELRTALPIGRIEEHANG